MEHVVLVIHLILALAIIALVLLQRSEGGGLGIGGSGGLGALASAGSTASALSRMTAICAGLFFCTSLILAVLGGRHGKADSLLDKISDDAPAAVTKTVPADDKVSEKVPEAPKPKKEEMPSVPVDQ